MSTSYNELNIPFVPLGSRAKRQMYLAGPILLIFKSLHKHLLSVKLLYANTVQKSALGCGQQPEPEKTRVYRMPATQQTRCHKALRGSKKDSQPQSLGTAEGCKHERNKARGRWLERRQQGPRGSQKPPGVRPPRHPPYLRRLPAPEMGFSVVPAGKQGILGEVAKPCRWGKAVSGT